MSQKKNGSVIAIITCMFLYAMISFVTNLGAPAGTVWKNADGIDGSNMLGMMGNMMNFLAYLFMGIPAGKPWDSSVCSYSFSPARATWAR